MAFPPFNLRSNKNKQPCNDLSGRLFPHHPHAPSTVLSPQNDMQRLPPGTSMLIMSTTPTAFCNNQKPSPTFQSSIKSKNRACRPYLRYVYNGYDTMHQRWNVQKLVAKWRLECTMVWLYLYTDFRVYFTCVLIKDSFGQATHIYIYIYIY